MTAQNTLHLTGLKLKQFLIPTHHPIYNSMFKVQNTQLSDIRVELKKGGRKVWNRQIFDTDEIISSLH